MTGTVTVKNSNHVVCVITLKNGTGTCKITAPKAPGDYVYNATFNGTGKYKTGSATTTLPVQSSQ